MKAQVDSSVALHFCFGPGCSRTEAGRVQIPLAHQHARQARSRARIATMHSVLDLACDMELERPCPLAAGSPLLLGLHAGLEGKAATLRTLDLVIAHSRLGAIPHGL